MKVVRAKISDELFAAIKDCTTHRGELSYVIKTALEKFVITRTEELRNERIIHGTNVQGVKDGRRSRTKAA